jgi:hypothetical protein
MHEITEGIIKGPLPASHKREVEPLAMKRWNMLHSPLHAAGFVLDPKYQSFDQHGNEEVMQGFWKIVEKLAPEESHPNIARQRAKYRAREGMFGLAVAISAAQGMAPYEWWLEFGASCPELQAVAVKVLSQCTAASACERSWSTFDFIHSKRRNRLTAKRSSDLVYVFSNLRMLDKVTEEEIDDELKEDN